jgi:hypothetical protein
MPDLNQVLLISPEDKAPQIDLKKKEENLRVTGSLRVEARNPTVQLRVFRQSCHRISFKTTQQIAQLGVQIRSHWLMLLAN